MNSQQAQVLTKWIDGGMSGSPLSEDEERVLNELIPSLAFIAELDEKEDVYHLIPTENTSCPKCGEKPSLLAHDGTIINSAFYICWTCCEVRQVGVGLVESSNNEGVKHQLRLAQHVRNVRGQQ